MIDTSGVFWESQLLIRSKNESKPKIEALHKAIAEKNQQNLELNNQLADAEGWGSQAH